MPSERKPRARPTQALPAFCYPLLGWEIWRQWLAAHSSMHMYRPARIQVAVAPAEIFCRGLGCVRCHEEVNPAAHKRGEGMDPQSTCACCPLCMPIARLRTCLHALHRHRRVPHLSCTTVPQPLAVRRPCGSWGAWQARACTLGLRMDCARLAQATTSVPAWQPAWQLAAHNPATSAQQPGASACGPQPTTPSSPGFPHGRLIHTSHHRPSPCRTSRAPWLCVRMANSPAVRPSSSAACAKADTSQCGRGKAGSAPSPAPAAPVLHGG